MRDSSSSSAKASNSGTFFSVQQVRSCFASWNVPPPAPYSVQRGLTRSMREDAQKPGDADRMQLWAGQAARLARG